MTIVDPCIAAVLSFDPAIVANPVNYVLFATADVQSILASDILSSETLAVCPALQIDIVNSDLTPIDPAIFNHDPSLETFTTYSTD